MMIGEWQEAEPEIGQVAMVHSISRGNFLGICRLNRSGDKVWYDENSGREYDLDKVDEWAPITTPEEVRLKNENEELRYWIHNTGGSLIDKLKAEVERLREGIKKHKERVNGGKTFGSDDELWGLIDGR